VRGKGHSARFLAGNLGISITGTFYNWQEKYPEFLEAVEPFAAMARLTNI
jgi:hypothetical protein